MHFDSEDLQQLTTEYLDRLPKERIIEIVQHMRTDLAKTQDRLNQNPNNSSKPSSSCDPWEKGSTNKNSEKGSKEENDDDDDASSGNDKSDSGGDQNNEPSDKKKEKTRKPGKQKGAKGFGRTQKLQVTETIIHRACECKGCNTDLDNSLPFAATGGHYTIDLKQPEDGAIGLQGVYIKHIYGEVECKCGFKNRTRPKKVEQEPGWSVSLGECRLIGPLLLAFLVFLKMRMHMTLSKTREFLLVWMGISLSEGCINTTLRESGRAASYLEPELLDILKASGLIYVDETSWNEHKIMRWMWTGVGKDVVYFISGARSKETAQKILDGFEGWIMSDGYCVYRGYEKRVRCWAHLKRKAQGLKESWNKEAASFGHFAVNALDDFIDSVYRMREMSETELEVEQKINDEKRLKFLTECIRNNDTEHEATSAFAREILNDSEAIFKILKHPELPLTNNAAERALRGLVILRKISQGSKTEEGSKTVSILASVIETLKRRKQEIWRFLAGLIEKRRAGGQGPPLPQPT